MDLQCAVELLIGSPYNFNGTATGYVLGGGLKYKLNPAWSVKAEYQYINLGQNTASNPAGVPWSGFGYQIDNENDYHTVRLGLNYYFTPAYEPLK